MQMRKTKKLVIDYDKLQILLRLGCDNTSIISALKLEPIPKTGDNLVDSILESLVDYREFDNWGGKRKGSGRKHRNQVENQVESQVVNQESGSLAGRGREQEKENCLFFNSANSDIRNTRARDSSINNTSAKNDASDPQINPPTLEEVLADASLQNEMAGAGGYKISKEEAESFFSTFAGSGWKIHNAYETPIRDWKAYMRQWAIKKERERLDKLEKDGIPSGPRPFRDDSGSHE